MPLHALRRPHTPLPPSQVTAGVLTKFVNFGTGWRPRLFVLRRGVLQYYKLDAADVPALLDGLRREGRLALVGAQVGVLEAAGRRLSSPMQDGSLSGAGAVGPATSAASLTPPPTTSGMLASPASDGRPSAPASAASYEPRPAAEVAMQVCTFALADADYRKFYVHSGTTTLRLRAETREDAWAWLAALRQAKAAWGTPAPTASTSAVSTKLGSPLALALAHQVTAILVLTVAVVHAERLSHSEGPTP